MHTPRSLCGGLRAFGPIGSLGSVLGPFVPFIGHRKTDIAVRCSATTSTLYLYSASFETSSADRQSNKRGPPRAVLALPLDCFKT